MQLSKPREIGYKTDRNPCKVSNIYNCSFNWVPGCYRIDVHDGVCVLLREDTKNVDYMRQLFRWTIEEDKVTSFIDNTIYYIIIMPNYHRIILKQQPFNED